MGAAAEDARKTLEVRQLNVREAADLMDALFSPDGSGFREHAIDKLMAGQTEIPSALVFAATGTTYDTFPLDIPPDDLPALFDEVAKLNPFLTRAARKQIDLQVAALEKIAAELEAAQAKMETAPATTSDASASSSP